VRDAFGDLRRGGGAIADELDELVGLDLVQQFEAAFVLAFEEEAAGDQHTGCGGRDEARELEGDAEGEGLHASW